MDDKNSFNESLDGDIDRKGIKDDRKIVNNAAENEFYRLVERPKYLISFDHSEQEADYYLRQHNDHSTQKLVFFILKCFIDIGAMIYCGFVLLEEGQ